MAGVSRISPRIQQTLPWLARSLHSSPSSSHLTLSLDLSEPTAAPGTLDLANTSRLFASTPSRELARTLAVLYAMALDPVVHLGIGVMRSKAVMGSRAWRAVVLGAMHATVYRHFCAGEGVEEAASTLQRLWDAGLRGILDYGLEDAENGDACDRNLDGFLHTVEMTSGLPPSAGYKRVQNS